MQHGGICRLINVLARYREGVFPVRQGCVALLLDLSRKDSSMLKIIVIDFNCQPCTELVRKHDSIS